VCVCVCVCILLAYYTHPFPAPDFLQILYLPASFPFLGGGGGCSKRISGHVSLRTSTLHSIRYIAYILREIHLPSSPLLPILFHNFFPLFLGTSHAGGRNPLMLETAPVSGIDTTCEEERARMQARADRSGIHTPHTHTTHHTPHTTHHTPHTHTPYAHTHTHTQTHTTYQYTR
jgi:hypothetical protein